MIFRYPFEHHVEVPDESLSHLILRKARLWGDAVAFIEGSTGKTLTYTQFVRSVESVASGIAGLGLGKGDVVAVLSVNRPEFALVFHGALLAGCTVTPINPLYTVEEIAFQLKDSGAKILVTMPELLERAGEAAATVGIHDIFVFGECEGARPFASLLASEGPVPDVAIDAANDVAAMPYSSGTTGLPKGVMLTHRNLVANLAQAAPLKLSKCGDVVLNVLPMFHIYGLHAVMNLSLAEGATLVTLPRFDLQQVLETIQKYHVTFAFLVPPIILAFAKHPLVDGYDLSSLKTIFSGAAPLDAQLTLACMNRLGVTIRQGYGMTETSPVATSDAVGSDLAKYGSVGVPIPLTEVKIADVETGEALGVNERGEICIRGPQVMKGYLNNPSATTHMLDPDGWLHTGDVGFADEDGYFFIVDRVKELIKYKGFQVPPAELEAILLAHPSVADAAVIPSPDEEAGEIPKAFVVRRAELSAEDVMAIVAEHVAPHKRIRAVEFVDQIPKSASGKILRRVLVDRERARLKELQADAAKSE